LKNKENLQPKEVKRLKCLFKQHPMLKKSYRLKEKIRSWYRSKGTLRKKKSQFKKIIHQLRLTQSKEFIKVADTYTNWFDEITNYFRCQLTNGYTEGFNNKIKTDKRKSYGYRSFKMQRFKVLLQ